MIQGAIYFPNTVLQINGSGNAVSLCAMWVAKDIVLTGNSGIAISARTMLRAPVRACPRTAQ